MSVSIHEKIGFVNSLVVIHLYVLHLRDSEMTANNSFGQSERVRIYACALMRHNEIELVFLSFHDEIAMQAGSVMHERYWWLKHGLYDSNVALVVLTCSCYYSQAVYSLCVIYSNGTDKLFETVMCTYRCYSLQRNQRTWEDVKWPGFTGKGQLLTVCFRSIFYDRRNWTLSLDSIVK